tara:strand:- start:54 stop:707 length:654 start_codon:yes stop_codon:yes gene_type:complete
MEDPLLQLISKKDWEFLKTRSKYHFKSDIIDPEFDTIGNIGKIIPTWTEKDLEMIATQSLSRMEDGDHSDYDMGKDGYDSNHVNISVSEKLPPFLKQIEHSFGLIQSTAWGYARPSKIVVQRPGQLWPLHMDLLEKWCPENPESIVRYVIHLTDWKPGQFWGYGNYNHSHWKSGDVTTFKWQDIPHCTANAGYHNRITFQVTGIYTETTDHFLNSLV